MLLKAGMIVPADIRIIECLKMKIDNFNLTGDSEALARTTECTSNENPLNSKNLAFYGTSCKEGEGLGIVFATGDNTIYGKLA